MFLQSGIVDDVITNVKFSMSNSTTEVSATLPHFWDYSGNFLKNILFSLKLTISIRNGSSILCRPRESFT